jgi:hypothetical protein
LKRQVKLWSKIKQKRDKELLIKVEGELEFLYHQKNIGSTLDDLDLHCKHLERVRNKLLLDEEERWRQKSRATWIKSGNNNTKFFHLQAIGETKNIFGKSLLIVVCTRVRKILK